MIICVEDDTSIRDLMIYALRTSGFEARGCNDGEELYAALEEAGRATRGRTSTVSARRCIIS